MCIQLHFQESNILSESNQSNPTGESEWVELKMPSPRMTDAA